MGINFPNAPAVGELHPTPPQAGVPQYRWDGVAWVAQSQDQLAFVKRTGDTMSGALTLPADPAAALQAATKQYVDAKSSLYISDNPPVGPPDGSMWWDSDNGLLYIRYNDGAGPSQWVQAVATPAIDASVFVNKAGDTMGGALTLPGDPAAALQAAPKQYVDAVRAYAAPYDAIAYSGMQINGSMEVSQERGIGGTTVTNASAAIADVFKVDIAGTGTVGIQQQTVVPPGFTNSVLLNCTAINTLAGTLDHQWLQQNIEGYRWSRLGWGTANAQPVTIGFWIQPPISGTMAVTVQTTVSPFRTYVVDVPVTAAAWQYKTVTIPGDVAGTWPKDNTTGDVIYFVFGVGSGRKTTANTWATQGTAVGTAATTNFFAAGGFTYITGVTVLPGTQAPTAAQSPTIMRPYDQELQTCMRYYQKYGGLLIPNSTQASTAFVYPVAMRATPTFSGGGAGFNSAPANELLATLYQTAGAYITLVVDARL